MLRGKECFIFRAFTIETNDCLRSALKFTNIRIFIVNIKFFELSSLFIDNFSNFLIKFILFWIAVKGYPLTGFCELKIRFFLLVCSLSRITCWILLCVMWYWTRLSLLMFRSNILFSHSKPLFCLSVINVIVNNIILKILISENVVSHFCTVSHLTDPRIIRIIILKTWCLNHRKTWPTNHN